MKVGDYLRRTREPRYSLLFALPLLLLYEVLALLLTGSAYAGVRNGADVLLKSLFVALGGPDGLVVFGLVLVGAGGFLVVKDLRRNRDLEGRLFVAMLGESLAYAALLGFVVGWLTSLVLAGPGLLAAGAGNLSLGQQLVISLGAGIYEELLFRVLLTGGLLWVLTAVLEWRRWVAVTTAVGLSAAIFSSFHYLGSLGDQFTVESFTYRLLAGIILSGLYVGRGLGVVAWTHALYDVMLAVA
ncbi:MAG TPA: CPBP family intramembrane glutamic endopeptidase [Gemmatimonadales bacterium]|nr:CPBP family intramembrane glutamic endopeptidase [Gemmatimonadales bacterium]